MIAILTALLTLAPTHAESTPPKVREALRTAAQIGLRLDMYYADCGGYPPTGDGLDALVHQPPQGHCRSWGQ